MALGEYTQPFSFRYRQATYHPLMLQLTSKQMWWCRDNSSTIIRMHVTASISRFLQHRYRKMLDTRSLCDESRLWNILTQIDCTVLRNQTIFFWSMLSYRFRDYQVWFIAMQALVLANRRQFCQFMMEPWEYSKLTSAWEITPNALS